MQIMGKKGIGNIIKIFLQICFFVGIIVLLFLPFMLQEYGLSIVVTSAIIYPNGITLLIITNKFIELFNSLKNNNPFCDSNVKILKNTSTVSLIGSLLWLLDTLYEVVFVKTDNIILILTMSFLFVLFFGVAIALYILSELLSEATKYKKENELTI